MLRLAMMMVMVSMCAATDPAVTQRFKALFEYSNLEETTNAAGVQVLNKADYDAFKAKLSGSAWDSKADVLGALFYDDDIRDDSTPQTRAEYVTAMDGLRAFLAGTAQGQELSRCRKISDSITDAILVGQTGGGTLTKATLKSFELKVGSLNNGQVEAYFAKLPAGDQITKANIGTAFCEYLTSDSDTVADMPMFGPVPTS